MAQPRPDRRRIDALTAALEAEFPSRRDSAPVEIVRAPGCVNLMGDHTDYNEGYVLPAAIELDTWIAFRRRTDGRVNVASRQSTETGSFRIDGLAPLSGVTHTWPDYVAGTAWSLREAALPVRGLDGVVDSTVPLGLGLSSSAALELASALALLAGGHVLAERALAALAHRAEKDYMGVDSGIMDQFASAAGREGRALLLDCRSLETRHVALPWGLRVVVCDTGAPPEPRNRAYRDRRAECARVVALLSEKMPGLCSLRDLDPSSLRRYRSILPDVPARRAEHVVAENGRVLATVAAMQLGDLDQLGRIFAESHASLRDLYQVSAPALDTMVEVARAVPGVVASRMTGPGFGGCTVNLVLTDAVPALKAAIGREYDRRTGLRGHAYPVAVVDGAGPLARG